MRGLLHSISIKYESKIQSFIVFQGLLNYIIISKTEMRKGYILKSDC